MHQSVKVSSKHQIALPAEAVRTLGIRAGDRLIVHVDDGVIMLIPMPHDPIEEPKGLGRVLRARADARRIEDQPADAETDLPPHSESWVATTRGLGRNAWEGVDAQEYVDRLRDEW